MSGLDIVLDEADAPLTEPLTGTITGARPRSRVTLDTRFKDNRGEVWSSRSVFEADGAGSVRLGSTPSVSGDFIGADPAALTASAKPKNAQSRLKDILRGEDLTLMPDLGVLEPLEWTVSVTSDGAQAETKAIRRRLARTVRRHVLSEGLWGELYEPDSPNGVGVLVIGGSEGGLFPARAALLASHGFTTMALAYFAHKGRPDRAIDLPIEYFFSGLNALRARPGVKHVAMLGVSRGSEAAQLTAISRPDLVDALILWVPSAHLNRGLDLSGGGDFRREETAMWARDGAPLIGVGFLERDIQAGEARHADFATVSGRRYADEFYRAWTQEGADAFRIPLERYNKPVLAVAGAEDALWPADYGAHRIIEATTASGSTASRTLICPSAGHLIGTPNEPRPFPQVMHWSGGYAGVDNGFCAYGGTAEGAAIAAQLSWRETVDFLRAAYL